jgi:hypothetical protein
MRFAPGGGSSGGGIWGSITGTLAAQTDLASALTARVSTHPRHYYVPAGTSIQSIIDAAVAAGHTDANPAWVIPQEARTEDLVLAPGVFISGGNASGTHAPVVITGTITVATTGGTLIGNHFSIERLAVVGPSGGVALTFSGTGPQRLFLRDVWLTAQGAGYCMVTSNTHASSHIVQADDFKLSHNGTGWCMHCVTGSTSIDKVETSGAVGVALIETGATLNIVHGECDANALSAFDISAGGQLVLGSCVVYNVAANSYAVRLQGIGAILTAVGTMFNVPTGTGRAVGGVTGSMFIYSDLAFAPESTRQVNPLITSAALSNTPSFT